MKNNDLLERLGALGFSLLDTEKESDPNLAIADLVKSRDIRLWEGFAVVLANSAQKDLFDYNKVQSYLKSNLDRASLNLLVALSIALYKTLNLRFSWNEKLYELLDVQSHKQYENYLKSLKNNKDIYINNRLLSNQRLKTTFNNYFKEIKASLNDFLSVKEEIGFEYALSQLFSPKQKELFLKKLRNEKLNKTEKEYFSRVVKKRVLALANSELHSLSQKLLQNL